MSFQTQGNSFRVLILLRARARGPPKAERCRCWGAPGVFFIETFGLQVERSGPFSFFFSKENAARDIYIFLSS